MKTIKEAWTWLIIIVLSMAIWNGCEEQPPDEPVNNLLITNR